MDFDWRESMHILGREFTPSLSMTLLYLSIGAAMLALGTWQMMRAGEKIRMQNAASLAAELPPVSAERVDYSGLEEGYVRAGISGRFEPEKQFLWDNRILDGQAGFEAIVPLRLADNRVLLVNRGWLPLGYSRDALPEIDFAAQNTVRFEGLLTQPSIGFSRGDAVNFSETEWPRLLQHFDFSQIGDALGSTVLPAVAQITRSDKNLEALQAVPLFKDNWRPVAFGPERHYGYAFQWFAMFVALSCLYFFLNCKPKATQNQTEA